MKRSVNEYLFYEFGLDVEDDPGRISDEWPFRLEHIGELAGHPVFRFVDGNEDYYALTDVLDFLPVADMSLGDLERCRLGSKWLAERNPLDLNTTWPGNAGPTMLERRRHLETLAEKALPGRQLRVAEGLYLRANQQQIGLVTDDSGSAWIVGDAWPCTEAPFPRASSHRRLAWAVAAALRLI